MEKIRFIFKNIFLIIIYVLLGGICGSIIGRIIIYFVDINMFQLVFSIVVGSIILMIVTSTIKKINNYFIFVGMIVGAFIGFVGHNIFNDVVLWVMHYFKINVYINPTKSSSYGDIYGSTIGVLSGLLIFILVFIEEMINIIKMNKNNYNIVESNQEIPNQKTDNIYQIDNLNHSTLNNNNKIKQEIKSESILDPYNEALSTPSGLALALGAKVATKYNKILDNNYIYSLLNIFKSDIVETGQIDIDDIHQEIIENEKDKFSNINSLCTKLKKINSNHKDKEAFMRLLFDIAFNNNPIYDDDMIFQIAVNINMDTEVYFALKGELNSKIQDSYNEIYRNNSFSNNTQDEYDSTIRDSIGSDMEDFRDENFHSDNLYALYKILEISPSDDKQAIKKQYRKLATKYHPDKYAGKELPIDMVKFAEERFKDINYAYDILKKYHNII